MKKEIIMFFSALLAIAVIILILYLGDAHRTDRRCDELSKQYPNHQIQLVANRCGIKINDLWLDAGTVLIPPL